MSTWTQADIDALKLAIKRGVLTVTFADRSVTYHSLKEMREHIGPDAFDRMTRLYGERQITLREISGLLEEAATMLTASPRVAPAPALETPTKK